MYKAPLTATAFKDFSSSYQQFSRNHSELDEPYVYVDAVGVKLLTGVVDEQGTSTEGVFALSVAGDGWVEMLAMYEAG